MLCSHFSSCRSVTGSSLSLSIIFILFLHFSLLERLILLSVQTFPQAHTLLLPLLSCESLSFSTGSGLCQGSAGASAVGSVTPHVGVCSQWDVQLCWAGCPPVPNPEITAVIITKSLSLWEGKDFLCFKRQWTAYRSLIMLREKAGTSAVAYSHLAPKEHAGTNSHIWELPCDQGVWSHSYLTSDTFMHLKQFPSRKRISTDVMEAAERVNCYFRWSAFGSLTDFWKGFIAFSCVQNTR